MNGSFRFFIGGQFKSPPNSTCLTSSAPTPWAGLLTEKYRCGTEPEGSTFSCLKPFLFVITQGATNAKWRARGTAHSSFWSPGTCVLYNVGYEVDRLGFSSSWDQLMVELDFSRLSGRDGESRAFDLPPHLVAQDPQVAALVRAMQAEIEGGLRGGRLFGEAISLALLTYIEGRYATSPDLRRQDQGLSALKLRRLHDFIVENLAQDLSLEDLAAAADMSPSHLCRRFKQATGSTPYRYVLNARIEKAKELLAKGHVPISDAALSVGFSSQSHFSDTFRRFTGKSPKQFLDR